MGNEIVYCTQCQSRLLAADFDRGKAVWSSERPYCATCIMGMVAALGPEEEQRILEQLAKKRAIHSGAALAPETPRRGTARKSSTSRIPIVKTERRAVGGAGSGPSPIALFFAGVALVVVVLLAAMLSGGSQRPAETSRKVERTPELPVREPVGPKPPAETPRDLAALRREESARKALEKARQYGKTNPADLPGRIALLEEAAWECRETPLALEARREHEELQKQRGEWITAQLAPAREKAQAAATKSQFGEAIGILEKERGHHPGADWASAVEQKILQIRQTADQGYPPMREKALAARRRGAEDEAQAIVKEVAAWGLSDLADELGSALAAVPLPEKPLSPEARAYLAAWETAFALARARDFPAALQGLEAAAAPLADPAQKAEAAADLELLRQGAAAVSEVLQLLAKWPKGQKIALEVDAGAGPVRVEGPVTRVSATWMEVKTEADAVQVEFDDLTAGSIAELLAKIPGRKAESDARVRTLLLLLEGAPSAAPGLPPRLAAYGTRVAQERSRPEWASRESEARARFESVERDYHDPATRLESFDRYRALLDTQGDNVFVRRKRALIAQRLGEEKDAGKEYFFFADQMRPAGSFRLASFPKAAASWISTADLPPDRENHVEFTFSAKASTEYRCWVFAGGCCQETFAFDLQGTEVEQRVPVKNTILFLKKTHALHGGKKEPTRFEWIAVPLPKYSSGGPKTVRLWSGQQGFSLSYALVSTVRTAAPSDAQVKEWERSRPAAALATSAADPGLVGWWTLDEGAGQAAADSSPNHLGGTLRGNPVWTSGKRRGALSFDGQKDYVEIPKNPKFYLPGPFTVAAWVNVGTLPQSKWGMYFFSDYSSDGGRSTFALRVMSTGAAHFLWQTEDTEPAMAASSGRLVPGTWAHVAGVWDGTTRMLYLNGVLDGTARSPQPRPDIGGHVSIGRPGAYNGLYFSGRLDDVRIYSRALSTAEIQSLVGR
jgi:hypothetical protein